MQKLTDQELQQATPIETEMIPSLYGTEHYFALVHHNGKKVLCLLGEDEVWRVVTYNEMMALM